MRTVEVKVTKNHTTEIRKGVFHGWGLEACKDDDGRYASETAAIIELEDGTCRLVEVCNVKFLLENNCPLLEPEELEEDRLVENLMKKKKEETKKGE